MSTANEVDRVAVPVIRAEEGKDLAVVTPDVVEEPKSTEPSKEIKASLYRHSLVTNQNLASFSPYPTLITSSAFSHHQNDALAITPVVAETATTPALDAAESAPFDSVPVVPAKHESTPAADSSVVKSAVDAEAPAPAVDGMVKAPTAEQDEVKKDVEGKKEVVQEKAKKEKRDKKTKKSLLSRISGIFSFHSDKSGTSSSASSDEEPAAAKPRTPPTTTVTPATPSKETTPIPAKETPAVVGSTSTVSESVTPVVAPSAAAEKVDVEGDKEAGDVAIAMGKLGIEDKGKGKEIEKEEVKETHIASKDIDPAAAAKPLDVPAPVAEGKEKPSLSPAGSPSPNPKIHRRISARIGQFMDFGKNKEHKADEKTKDGDSFVSASAEGHHARAVVPAAAVVGAVTAVKRESAKEAPVLGAPVTVEPMGELIPAKETEEPVKPTAV